MKRIGVLTSGGDCAGLNAAIRSVVLHATQSFGWQVFGFINGTNGLIHRPMEYVPLTIEQCSKTMLRQGGTIIGSTNKADPFNFPCRDGQFRDQSDVLIEGYKELGLDALIGIGGDGSLKILRDLAIKGNLNLVTIPKTIDNDLARTEIAIGYSTALDIATEALDRLHSTAASHQRIMILEVMGRDAGHIAMGAGIAGGADAILIPEIPYKVQDLCQHIKTLKDTGRNDMLIVVAESVPKEDGDVIAVEQGERGRMRYGGIGHYIAEQVTKYTSIDTRVTVLGHVQRGGQPNALDRVIGSAFGVKAVELITQGKFDTMVAWKNRRVIDVPILEAISHYQSVPVDDILVKTAKGLGIYLGNVTNEE